MMGRSTNVHRGFTLIEVVIAVIVLAISVPPTLNMMDSSAAGRVDAIQTTRATLLATIVLESVMADMTSSSAGLGFAALDDSVVYLETAGTGFYDRISGMTAAYTDVGLSYQVQIGVLVGSDGVVSQVVSENVFRIVTVEVSFLPASGAAFVMPISLMVSEM